MGLGICFERALCVHYMSRAVPCAVMCTMPTPLFKNMLASLPRCSMVSFIPLDISDEDSIGTVLGHVDMAIQYGEDTDVKIPRELDEDGDQQDKMDD